MRRSVLGLLLVGFVCLGLACAETTDTDREKVVAQLKNIFKSFEEKNVDGILASYADDAREIFGSFQLDGKANIRKFYEQNLDTITIKMNAGSKVYQVTGDIYAEEVGNQRVLTNVFPRFRLWKKTASGDMLLWRHAANGFIISAPTGIESASAAENAAVCQASAATCNDEQKLAQVKAKIPSVYASILSGSKNPKSPELTSGFSKQARLWAMSEHLAGLDAISGLFYRVTNYIGLELKSVNMGTLYFLNDTLVMEESGSFETNMGSGRIFNLWQIVPKVAPANSIPTETIDDAHAGEAADFDVKLWRSVVTGPVPVAPPTKFAQATQKI